VTNVAPTAAVAGPADGVRGQTRMFTLTATDPSAVDQAAGFTFTVDWGDGSSATATGPSGMTLGHVYTDTGTYTVRVTATDKDGGTSDAAESPVSIAVAELQGDTLAVGGSTGADVIGVSSSKNGAIAAVNGVTYGFFAGVTRVVVFGQAGDDVILVAGNVAVPAEVYGGDGNDYLHGGAGDDILHGGAGNDIVQAGSGNDVLDGGTGFLDVLIGGAGNDVMTDPDGVAQASGGAGDDTITITFAPDWNYNGSFSLPAGAISGGEGNDTIRVTSAKAGMSFDVSGGGGDDRIELYGVWTAARVHGGKGTDTLMNRGIGVIQIDGIEVFE
jgi:Ca2+-binding RTX toxin-like protein